MNSCVAVRAGPAGDNNSEDTPKKPESGKPKDTAKEADEPEETAKDTVDCMSFRCVEWIYHVVIG